MPPKKSEAPARMCGARKCGSTNSNVPEGIPKVYRPKRCDRACAEGSNVCTLCMKQEAAYIAGKKGTWHGRFEQANIPDESHMRDSKWFADQVAKLAAKEAKAAAAAAAAVPDPAVKAAAKVAEQEAKAAAALQKRLATQAAAFEREQAAYFASMGRIVDQEMKAAEAAEKAAVKAQRAAAASEARATRKAKPAAGRRSSSVRRSSAKRAAATIYLPASAAAAAAARRGSSNTLGSLALSSDNSSNLRYYAQHPELGYPGAAAAAPRSSSSSVASGMVPGALRSPASRGSSGRSTRRNASPAFSQWSSGRRSSSRSQKKAASPMAAPAPAARPVVQTNGAGIMVPAEQMLNLDRLLAEIGGNANLY